MYKVYYGGPETDLSQMGSDYVLMDPSTDTRIHDAKVDMAVNAAGTFKFNVSPDHQCYSIIALDGSKWVKVFWDTTCLFAGRVTDIVKNKDTTLTVTAKDAISDLADVKFRFKSGGDTDAYYASREYVLKVFEKFNEINFCSSDVDYGSSVQNPLNVGRTHYDRNGNASMVVDVEPTEGRSALDYLSTILGQNGCYLAIRNNMMYVRTSPIRTLSTTLRLGEHIKDIKVETDVQDFPTAVYAMGGKRYAVQTNSDGPYDNHTTHFKLAADKPAGTSLVSVTFDRSVSSYIYDHMYIYNGGSPAGGSMYSLIEIDYHPSRSHTFKSYVGYGSVWVSTTYVTVNDGDTVNIYVDGLVGTELRRSDNIDIIIFSDTQQDGHDYLKADCIPRESAYAGVDMASSENPIATTYQGTRLWVDYNMIILRDAAEQYGIQSFDYVDDTIRSPDTLFDRAYKELVGKASAGMRITVDAVDPVFDGIGSHMQVGDSVNILSEQHGVDTSMMLTGMSLDLNAPANNRYTFGPLATSISDKIDMLNGRMASMRDYLRG